MAQYSINPKALVQRYFVDSEQDSLCDYAKAQIDNPAFDGDATTMAVSLEGRIFLLNLSAGLIFEGIANGKEIEGVTFELSALYDVEEDELTKDVAETFASLVDDGLIVPVA